MVAASLLIVGPNPAQAVADKNRHSYDDYLNGSSGNAKRGGSNWTKDVLGTGNTDNDPKQDPGPPLMDVGTGGGDLEDLAVANTFSAPEGQVAMRSAAVAEPPTRKNVVAAAPRNGSDYSGQPVTAFRSPRVVVGNGRTPGTHVPGSAREAVLKYDSLVAPEAVPVAPAVPEAIEINILPPPLPPVERIRSAELAVGEFGTGTADTVTDPLAGVAGLILIPAIGAVLGYRQARAAQSMRESIRS